MHKPLPGPRGRELLDGLRLLQRDPLSFLIHCTRDYGDFVRLPLGVMEAVLLNHPEAVKHVLQDNHRNYSKDTFQYNLLSTITGRGLLTSDGDDWLRQRRLAQPAFHRSRIASLGGMIQEAADKMLAGWELSAREGRPVDVDAEMMRLTLEVVGRALFSVDLSAEAGELARATLISLDYLIHRSRNPFSLPPFVPTRRNREFRAALRVLNDAVYRLIADRRARMDSPGLVPPAGAKADSEVHPESGTVDLLGMLLEARDIDTGAAMDDRQVRDEVITLLIAGHETVASALTWTLYLLAQHPEKRERLQAELAAAHTGSAVPAANPPDLPFTQRVFDEALRLYPPAWIITRKALNGDEVLGYPIPKGALVILSPYTLHRHPDFWEDPDCFDPDRFSADKTGARPRYAYFPFGGGPRLCIGDSFARFEAHLILAAIHRRFRLDLVPGQNVQVEALVTLRPKNGLRMVLKPLESLHW